MDHERVPLSYRTSGLGVLAAAAAYTCSPRVFRESALRQTHAPHPSDGLYLYDASVATTENTIASPLAALAARSSHGSSSSYLGELSSPAYSEFAHAKMSQSRYATQPSPRTPFHDLFSSSPCAFWVTAADSSVSPVARQSSDGEVTGPHTRQKAQYHQLTKDRRPYLAVLSPLSDLSSIPSSPEGGGDSPVRAQDGHDGAGRHLGAAVAETVSSRPVRTRMRTTTRNARASPPPPSLWASRPARRAVTSTNAGDAEYAVPAPKRRRVEPQPKSKPKSVSCTDESVHAHSDDDDDGASGTAASSSAAYPQRTFPAHVPVHAGFPLFYRRFPVSSYSTQGDDRHASYKGLADASFNPPRERLDLYTPRFVKGRGTTKVGLCPCCCESVTRGGVGQKVWLSMKFSAFKCYHMQYAHGISAMTGRPFSPPVAFRTVARPTVGKHEKSEMMQGKCHKCAKWVPVEGVKDVPAKVKEIYWWKHAAACHQGSTLEGECDIYVDDEVYHAIQCSEGDADGDDDED